MIISRATYLSVAVLLTLGAAGCSASASAVTPTTESQTDFRTARCNLGEVWDRDALLKRARYDEPTLPSEKLKEQYGPAIANDSCTDAEIIKWQELRLERGEDDAICRIVWFDDYFSAVTYDIGCAVPLVVMVSAVR